MNDITKTENMKNVANLVVFPKSMDSLNNIKENIKAYGYLQYCFGNLYGVVKQLENHELFKEFYNDVKKAVSERNFSKLIDIYNLLMKHTKNKKEKTVINTVIIILMHNVNNELNLYNI